MDILSSLLIVLLSLLIVDITSANKKRYGVTKDAFCDEESLRQTAVFDSGLQCTRECHNDANCVAISQQNSQCVLHSDFCSTGNLKAKVGALYIEISWECEGSSCYYMPSLTTPITKPQADVFCEAMGAHVVATETRTENQYIKNLVYESRYSPAAGNTGKNVTWIDLIDDVMWYHSGQSAIFTNWAIALSQPDDPDENCTAMVVRGKWRDLPCSDTHTFLCEREN